MILRAWHHWLRTINPQKPSARRRFLSRGVESLEVRCLPAVTVSGSATAPVLTVSNGDDLVIAANGSFLTFDLGTGAGAVAFGGAQGAVTSLRITCSSSSSSSGNTIQLALNRASDGLSGSFQVTVTANGGPDLIDASGTDFPVSLNGGGSNDTLLGGSASDIIDGSTGNDILIGGMGNDNLMGGSGTDNISGEDGDDQCFGGDNNDSISGGDGNDLLNGQGGDDSLSGDGDDDELYGGAGRDVLSGGDGDADFIKGQGGLDTIFDSWSNVVNELAVFRSRYRSTANLDPRDMREYAGFDAIDTSFVRTKDEFVI